MKTKTCPNGHIYDEDLYPDGCPYCNPDHKVIHYDEPSVEPIADDATTMKPINRTPVGSSGATVAPVHQAGQDTGRTVKPNPRHGSDGSQGTVVISHHDGGSIPVTGWLVCIDGPSNLKGRSFEVRDKINTVGRDWSNDIRLDDPTVTAVDHARVAFDPKHREFALLPEKNTNMIYLNDHAIYSPTPLSAYDVIELGEGSYLFVPLCGPRFGWDTGLEKPGA